MRGHFADYMPNGAYIARIAPRSPRITKLLRFCGY